jgi:hypothetical protein
MTDIKDLKKIKKKLDNYKPSKANKDAKKMSKSILKSLGIKDDDEE